MVFKKTDYIFQGFLCLLAFPGCTGYKQLAGLPDIVMVIFYDGYIKFFMQA
jgi:hypothetical protein